MLAAAGRLTLSSPLVAVATAGDAAATLALFDEEGYCSIDTRSLYQSTLLHTASKHGHTELARALLQRGANVNMLDFGGMRRSPLHWACHGGHVALVELLLEAGADTTVGGYADGRSWSKLVQGSRCGSLIPRDQPTESVESMCRTNAVRLALTRPAWHPGLHHMWPQRFRDAVRLLLLAASCPPGCRPDDGCSGSGDGSSTCPVLPLSQDLVLEVVKRAAYPISRWM